jgi:hypothetical protein
MDQYQLNLLSVPRESASMGDVYIREGDSKRLSFPSHIWSFLESGFEMPHPTIDETFGNNISGSTSNQVDANIGLEFSKDFLISWVSAAVLERRYEYILRKRVQENKLQFCWCNSRQACPWICIIHGIVPNNLKDMIHSHFRWRREDDRTLFSLLRNSA